MYRLQRIAMKGIFISARLVNGSGTTLNSSRTFGLGSLLQVHVFETAFTGRSNNYFRTKEERELSSRTKRKPRDGISWHREIAKRWLESRPIMKASLTRTIFQGKGTTGFIVSDLWCLRRNELTYKPLH